MRLLILAMALTGLVAASGCQGVPAGSRSAYTASGEYTEGGTAVARRTFVETNGGSGGGT